MDRIKSICIEEELCQSHDGSLEQILKQMLSYKKLYNVILRAEKGETYNSIKNRYSLGFLEETDLGSKMEIEFQTDSFEILSKQLIEYGSGIEIVQPDELIDCFPFGSTIRKLLELVIQVRVFIFGKWIRLFKRVKETSHIRSSY